MGIETWAWRHGMETWTCDTIIQITCEFYIKRGITVTISKLKKYLQCINKAPKYVTFLHIRFKFYS